MSAWHSFVTAPRDRTIFATEKKPNNTSFPGRRYCGQRLVWSEGHQEWLQCVRGRWYVRPFFTPTHWADIQASGERPEPMF
jgi:hypothetical protein